MLLDSRRRAARWSYFIDIIYAFCAARALRASFVLHTVPARLFPSQRRVGQSSVILSLCLQTSEVTPLHMNESHRNHLPSNVRPTS